MTHERLLRRATAIALFVAAFIAVLAAQRDVGVVRDEVVYRDAGSRYARWWIDLVSFEDGTLTEKEITAHFGGKAATAGNREHPPLMKTLFGFSDLLFDKKLGWTTPTTAFRLPSVLFNAVLIAMLFLFTVSIWGYAQGLIAALLTLLLPRAFFHAGLACFDGPMVAVWFATLAAYYKALESRWWVLGFGVCFGLALATKHNAILLPFALVTHYVWVSYRSQRAERGPGFGGVMRALGRGLWRTQPLLLPAMLIVAPLVLVALWPWLWFDTFEHVGDWMRFHFHHVHYNFEYLGENWNTPPFPWHVAIVTTLFTVPVVTLLAGTMGVVDLVRKSWRGRAAVAERAPALLLFLSAGVSMGPFLLGSTPIFGAEKHWAPAIPTICIYAGVGLVAVGELTARRVVALMGLVEARTRLVGAIATVLFGALAVSAALVETADAQPYALSHYNALAGGAPGGADLGMNRQFWGYSARGVLPFLEQRLREAGGRRLPVYSHDASPAWGIYQREGLLSRNLPDAGHEDRGVANSQLAIVVHELHFRRHDYMIWKSYGTVQPVYVLTTDGVPIVSVYARGATSSTSRSRPR